MGRVCRCRANGERTAGERPRADLTPFWHLYSAVGPNGDWSIASTREAKFSLLDDSGNILRTWEPRHLPRELNAGKMIPPRFLAGADAERMVAFAPQSRALFRFRIVIGSAQSANERVMRNWKTFASCPASKAK